MPNILFLVFTALSIQPNDALMYKLRADIRGKLGFHKEAVEDYKQAIAIQEQSEIKWKGTSSPTAGLLFMISQTSNVKKVQRTTKIYHTASFLSVYRSYTYRSYIILVTHFFLNNIISLIVQTSQSYLRINDWDWDNWLCCVQNEGRKEFVGKRPWPYWLQKDKRLYSLFPPDMLN